MHNFSVPMPNVWAVGGPDGRSVVTLDGRVVAEAGTAEDAARIAAAVNGQPLLENTLRMVETFLREGQQGHRPADAGAGRAVPTESLSAPACRNRFKNPLMRAQFDACVAGFAARHRDLVRPDGMPHRGNAAARYFWLGFEGVAVTWDAHSKQAPVYAAYRAGQAVKRATA